MYVLCWIEEFQVDGTKKKPNIYMICRTKFFMNEHGWQTKFYINLPVFHLSLEFELGKIGSIDAGFSGKLKDIISLFSTFVSGCNLYLL